MKKEILENKNIVYCPECNSTNIENPYYNDYYCMDCHTPFDV